MSATSSMTRWRDEPIVPEDYEDVTTVICVARKARGRIVEFDWAFTGDDLLRLRREVYEWGTEVVGRYKCFDARVLAAINDALGETGSPFVHNEPKKSQETDCKVSCVGDGDFFRLQGHAPFDIVFGYGSAAVEQDPGSVSLGPMVREDARQRGPDAGLGSATSPGEPFSACCECPLRLTAGLRHPRDKAACRASDRCRYPLPRPVFRRG